MFNFKAIVSGVSVALVSATMAVAEDEAAVLPGSEGFTKYGEVEGWTVYADIERKSCLIESVDAAENVVQMGLTKDHKFGYVGVFSKGDTGAKHGEKSDIYISIDGQMFSSEATGIKGTITKGYTGGYILANNPEFIDAVANKKEMAVFPEKNGGFVVNLHGTKKAMEMARECNAKQG